jgi:hypothetical protein
MGKRTKGAKIFPTQTLSDCFRAGLVCKVRLVKFSEVKKELKADPDGVLIDVSGWPVRYLETLKKRHRSADEMCAGHYGANHGSQA